MTDCLVTCIRRHPDQRFNTYDKIQLIAGITVHDGQGWSGTPQQVADWIKSEKYRFFTHDPQGNRTYLHWVEDPNGDYVKTYANRVWTDNLGQQPECA